MFWDTLFPWCRNFFNNAPCGLIFYGRCGHRLRLNSCAQDLLGRFKSLKAFGQSVTHEDHPAFERLVRAVSSREKAQVSLTIMNGERKKKLVFHHKPLLFKRGFIFVEEDSVPINFGVGVLSSFHFLNNLPLPSVIIDGDGRIIYANESLLGWLGFVHTDLIGKSLEAVVVGDPRMFEQDGPSNVCLRDHNGCQHQASLSRGVDLGHQGKKIVFMTPKLQKVDAKTKMNFALLLENLPMPALFLDHQGVILLVNRSFEQLVRERKILGRSLKDWLEEGVHDRYGEFLKKSRRQNAHAKFLLTKMAGKNPGYMRLYANYMSGSEWDPMGCFLILLYDVTDLKKREVQSIESQKLQALGQLASGISHDFNNLLTAMLGFCDLLLQRHSPQDNSFTDIMQIKQNANRAANLIRQLLLFAKHTSSEPKAFNLRECLNEMSFLLRRLIGVTIELRIEHDRSVKDLYADQGQIEQLIMNLAINARDAMPRGGTLTFRTRHVVLAAKKALVSNILLPGDYVTIEVEDTGCGVPEKNIRKIFDPFFSTKDANKGTGLGLATVDQILRKMKGGVDVDSVLGKGTKFTLYMPHTALALETSEVSQKEDPKTRLFDFWESASVLIVEDEDPVRLFVARGLKSKGYEVFEARDGAQGLDLLKHNQGIQLLITDIMMPGMDGPMLANAAYSLNPSLEVIFVSGFPNENIYEQLKFPKTQAHFLAKPFNLDELTKKAREALSRRRARA
jgi:two-component system cell cycle sensor histidine kinase/response regulator CckA